MSIKLFVSDIDGTLVISGKYPSEKTVQAFQKMTNAGIMATVATGRMYRAALPMAQAVGIKVPIITYNGALIKSADGEILYSSYLEPELVVELVEYFQAAKVHLQTYSEDKLRYAEHNGFSEMYEASQKTLGEAVGWEGLKKFTSRVCKVLAIFESEEANNKFSEKLKEKFAGRIDVTRSSPTLAEIINPGVSKAAAIKILAKKFGFDKSEVATIGDGDNDLEMLAAAGMSIAMGNANDKVKSACEFVTGNCEDDGLAQAVEKYILR